MKYIIYILTIYCVSITLDIKAQHKSIYIPEWNKNYGVTKITYDKEVKELKESIDSLNLLSPNMPRYRFRKGAAMISILSSYGNLKVSIE